jgi:tRNA 2-thiouridine synthesizing protein A
VTEEPAATVDATGRLCPLPVIELARVIAGVRVGSVVELLADDPAAAADVAAWCRMRDQELVTAEPTADPPRYLVRRLR